MILGFIAMGICVGGLAAFVAVQAGYPVILAVALYAGCGGLSVLLAAGAVFAVSEVKCRVMTAKRRNRQAQQAEAAV